MSLEDLKQEALSSSTSPKRLREIAAISNELAKLVASNPVADSKLLDEIALQARNNRDTETQRAIALNPNTSEKLLVELAHVFPEEFFTNPAYDLSIINEVNFKHLSARKLLLKLASTVNAPTSFLSFAAEICQPNIQKITKDKYYPYLTLEQQYQNRLKNKLGIVSYYPFEYFWKWREILIAIASHKNTSRNKLKELSAFDEPVIAEIAKIRLKHHITLQKQQNNNDLSFWSEVILCKSSRLFKFIPNEIVYKLVQLPNISLDILSVLSNLEAEKELLGYIASHPKASPEILNKLSHDNNQLVAASAKLHINYADDLKIDWKKLAERKINPSERYSLKRDNQIELRLWRAGAITDDSLFYLAKDETKANNTLLYIICAPDTPPHILDKLKINPHVSQLIKDCIAFIKDQKSFFLEELPTSLPAEERKRGGYTKYTPDARIDDLDDLLIKAQDSSWRVRKRWTEQWNDFKNIPFHICLVSLVQERYPATHLKYYLNNMLRDYERDRYRTYTPRKYAFSNLEYYGHILAKHFQTSREILAELTQHRVKEVRVLVASHPNITQNSLFNLISDRDIEVRKAALANPKLDSTFKQEFVSLEDSNLSLAELQELANSKYKIIREKVALHPNVTRALLIKLSNDKFNVRIAVAKNPKTPLNILLKYVNHPDKRLHFAVAENSGTPVELLIKLGTQQDSKNQNGYHFNPLNLLALKTLLKHHPDEAIPILDRCLKYPDRPSYARFLVLMNPNISSKFLARYYKSWFWIERYAIAQNPNTDTEIRQYLANDCNCLVRAAARSFLK